MSINNNQGFAAKNVYPSEQGLHIECSSQEEAQAAYADCKQKGMNVELDGTTVTWRFHNPKKPIPMSIPLPVFDKGIDSKPLN
ncbi:hypothetical protein RIVM261_053400 [Rivularia sp. IAM M-261]|nr:hypothetical protein RIVM261_053400 [Rivularia sp. IAM M-261]